VLSRKITNGLLGLYFLAFFAGPLTALAQQDSLADGMLKVYVGCLDCSDNDLDFFKTEIDFIDFVRDRSEAEIHIIITSLNSGSGGKEYTLYFLGLKRFLGEADTLTYLAGKSDSEDVIRRGIARIMAAGLFRYALKTPAGERLFVKYKRPLTTRKAVDKWNRWVFDIGADSYVSGEKGYRCFRVSGNISAKRITAISKIKLSISGTYEETRYEYGDYSAFGQARQRGASATYIRGINNHWSWGVGLSASHSLYSNLDFRLRITPAMEYNFIPYSESTRRQLRLSYQLGVNYSDYIEKTIYNKHNEWLGHQELKIALELIQPWGSIETALSASNYLHDFKKNQLTMENTWSLNLFRGFSLDIISEISRVHDQIYISGAEMTEEEILLQQKEIETSYSYQVSIGISYSFGSIYSDIINPRFGD
jgi:hypothetical protein